MGFSGILSNRHDLYLLGLVLGLANVGFQHAVQDAVLRGFWPALSGLFDISAMIWAALLAMAVILHSAPEGQHAGSPRSSRLDYIWVGLVVLACLLPIKLAAALATACSPCGA